MSDFSGNSAKLAVESIRNAYFREHYIQITRQVADDILQQTKQAEVLSPCQQYDIWKGAARKAHAARNKLLVTTRNRLSASALAFSKVLKHKAPTFSELIRRYTSRYCDVTDGLEGFSSSTRPSQITVFKMIVSSAGRTNSKVNTLSKSIAVVGALTLVITTMLFIHGVVNAGCAAAYVLKSAVTFHTGLAGAYIGSRVGATLTSCCGFSYIVVFLTSVIVGLILGIGAAAGGNAIVSTVFVTMFKTDATLVQVDFY